MVVGHVCRDVVPATGAIQVGGTAFYSGLQAARLGLRTLIVTAGVPGELEELLAPYAGELDVRVQPADRTTAFEAVGQGRGRRLRLLDWAGPIAAEPGLGEDAILHLAPVARETEGVEPGAAAFVGLTPQGLIRRWDEQGEVAQATFDPARLPRRLDALVVSDTERESCAGALAAAVERGAAVAVTAGAEGAEVLGAAPARAPALRVVEPLDDLGAGDVFATAFFAALAAGAAAPEAMQRGQAAALHRLSGVGPGAVATAAQIDALLAGG